MKILLIFLFFVFKSNAADNFDKSYLLFIGSNNSDYQKMSVSSNFACVYGTKYFNPIKLTVLIIHGWTRDYEGEIEKMMVDAFRTRPGYNIIFADWGEYATVINFFDAVGAIPGVAKNYIQQLNQLKSRGYDLTKIYVVGHSLGAQLAGKIGELFRLQNVLLSRITGLDPTGAAFTKPVTVSLFGLSYTSPPNSYLRKGNAKFVDIIHTDANTAGSENSTGDVDFWPNGGKNQPMCPECDNPNFIRSIGCSFCDHFASVRYFIESVRSIVPKFRSLRCPTSVYASNTCTGPATAYMGFYASSLSQPGNYYLATRAAAPYSY